MVFEKVGDISFSVALFGLLSFLVVFSVLKSLVEKRHIFRFATNYKGHTFYPIIGNGIHMIGKNVFHGIRDITEKFGLPCNLWLGHDYHYITADPSEIKTVLNCPNSFDKMRAYENMEVLFGQALLLAPVDVWKRNRKYIAKSFSQPVLNTFVRFFYKKSVILLDILKDADKRNIFEVFQRYTLDSFCESIIGIDYDLQVESKTDLVECITEIQAVFGKRLITSFYYPFYIWMFSNEGRRAMRLMKRSEAFVHEAIKERRKAFGENPVCLDSNTALPLLDALLQAKDEKFTEKQIFEEILLFTTGATDTSGNTLAFLFTMLGMHPEIQRKVYEEVMAVVGRDRPIYSEDLPNLKYTERVIFETLRILPVVPFLGRKATADIDCGTKIIPKGINIIVSIFDLHRNEKHWPDPLKFDPERFLPEEVAKRDPYAFIPFSGGARNCIGKTYSVMLMKTCAANVVRNYELSTPYKSVSELKLESCITMMTMHPLECHFKPRNHN